MKTISDRFMAQWECRRSSSAAICRLMMPWWTYTHVLQLPRKFVQFLPPMLFIICWTSCKIVAAHLDWLQAMVLSALNMICNKMALTQYIFSCTNQGTQPAIIGCQAMILQKLQTMSPRARCAVSAAEIQTVFAKMESFTSTLSTPGQTRMLLDIASLPLGYYFLYRLYGLAAIAVSILANAVVTAPLPA